MRNTGGEAGGDWATAIAESGRFVGRGVVSGGGDGGVGGGWGSKNFFGGRPGVGVVKLKGGGRQHHSGTTGGAAGLLSGAVVPGSARGTGDGRHGAFSGSVSVFKHSLLPSGGVSVDVGEPAVHTIL